MPDGMKSDTEGNIHVTAPGGVWIYDKTGPKLGEILVPQMVANLHWGGDNWDTQFMCATTVLYGVQMKAHGRPEPFIKRNAGTAQTAPAVSANGLNIDPQRTALIIQDMQNVADITDVDTVIAALG